MLNAARNVVIKNGKLGRASHHGIHGNDNENVVISDLVINDWEVAAISLNHVKGLRVRRVSAASRRDVPVTGSFSVGRFFAQEALVSRPAFSLVLGFPTMPSALALTPKPTRDSSRS